MRPTETRRNLEHARQVLAWRPWSSALSALIKVYTVAAMIGERRWRALAFTDVVFAISVLLTGDLWAAYLSEAGTIGARLIKDTDGGGFSAFGRSTMIPTMAALIILANFDTRAAAWFAVPAIWPGTQVYCATFMLPISLLLFLAGSLPIFGVIPVTVAVYVLWRVVLRTR